jgi:hypothetical protein
MEAVYSSETMAFTYTFTATQYMLPVYSTLPHLSYSNASYWLVTSYSFYELSFTSI